MAELRERLAKAERPLMIVGGPTWDQAGGRQSHAFVEANDLPVDRLLRAQDRFDNRNDHYAGHAARGLHPEMRKRDRDSRSDHRRRPAARRDDDRRLYDAEGAERRCRR